MLHLKNYTTQKEQFLYGVVIVFVIGALLSAGIRFYTHEYIITLIDFCGLVVCLFIMHMYEKNRNMHRTVISLFWVATIIVFLFVIYFQYSLHILLVLMIPLAASILVEPKTFIFHGSLFLLAFTLIMSYGFFNLQAYPYLQNREFLIAFFLLFFYVLGLSLVYNQSIEKSYQKLALANHQKEVLLKEVHHRVKNNLNIVASILGLEKLASKSDEVHKLVNKNRLRIESIAMIHEILYTNSDFEHINFSTYMEKLTQHILETEAETRKISLQLDITDLELDIEEMIQFGIIINELMTNTIKYAFNDTNGSIYLTLSQQEDLFVLSYLDNGKGLQNAQEGFGRNLIAMCVDQLDASLQISETQGLEYLISFRAKKR